MLKAYLAGPIASKQDLGQRWREKISPELLKLGIQPINPTREQELGEIKKRIKGLQEAKRLKRWEDFVKIMHKIWVMNKRWVDEADFVIVYCKDSDNLSGTIREMHEAYEYKKPIFLVVDGDPSKLKSHTLYMALKGGRVFKGFDELFGYLEGFIKIREEDLKEHSPDLYQVSQKLLIVNDNNQLLILQSSHHNLYDLPGGRLNVGEFNASLVKCLEREVREELGDRVQLKIDYRPVVIGRELLWDRGLQEDHYRKVFLIGYGAQYLGGRIKLCDEHICYKWVNMQNFNPKGLFRPGHGMLVQEFLRQKSKLIIASKTSIDNKIINTQ